MTYEPIMVPPRNSRTTRTVLIVVGVVLSFCCVGGVVGGFALWNVVQHATGPAQDSVDRYAAAMVARDFPTAYGQLCGQVRNRLSQYEFARQQSAQPSVRSYEIVSVNVLNTNGRVHGEAQVRFVQSGGARTTQVFPLVKEDGEWRICE
ncbi:hypothetical protein GA0070624_6435 [Micromonospora rhizosphaerae]|uniref:DUF4878 domain-containing protein n=1 Tax=Micromonospora rhizosphaerae TaxID=568872 RepID=A0A1C6TBA1_9ACTN|nr:nuclear transport factor 2 family protein [Micromonospora rhizosphaerae]SCL39061.1 hypothetical protein GA0070624_6435 [Micromonospora rhizosphaerae]